MGKTDEVLPDSQDEAEFDALDLLEREFSPLNEQPLTHASIPSLLTSSSSFELPPPMPANHTVTSTISQFTTETVLNTLPEKTSVISAFTTSSSPKTIASARSRPKPKPNYAGAEINDPIGDVHASRDTSTESSSAARRTQDISQPDVIFATDISERIKTRRAKKDMKPYGKAHSDLKKSSLAAEAVIEISSDDNIPSGPSNFPSPLKRPGKQINNSRSIISFRADGTFHNSASGSQDTSLATTRKPTRDPLSNTRSIMPASPVETRSPEKPLEPQSVQDPAIQSKKKKKRKFIDDSTEGSHLSERASKKRSKGKGQRLKNSPAISMEKNTEKGQFRSNEFILDSDNEIAPGNEGDTNTGTTVVSLPITNSPLSPVARSEYMPEAPLTHDHEPGSKSTTKQMPKKAAKQKRKPIAKQQDEVSTDTEDRPCPSKKVRRNEDIPHAHIAKEKPTVTAPTGSDIQNITDSSDQMAGTPGIANDSLKTKKTKRRRNVIEDDEQGEVAKENTDPLSKLSNTITSVQVTKASQTLYSDHKQCHAHPPKNRPLSAILQRVNGSAPRPRASPSISRSLLTRIVPLHPNRRTPPPPPPPRIIPKKTKKEIEREEKWEEELQETVEGWCELEEAERERMRKAKRDWELGLYEE